MFLKAIKFYQKFISPSLPKHCRFYPTCSQYYYLSVKKHGAFRGSWQGIKRILRCHPFNSGGIDIP